MAKQHQVAALRVFHGRVDRAAAGKDERGEEGGEDFHRLFRDLGSHRKDFPGDRAMPEEYLEHEKPGVAHRAGIGYYITYQLLHGEGMDAESCALR